VSKSRTIEEAGESLRLYERNGVIYYALKVGRVESASGIERTKQIRRSLGTADWEAAEGWARDYLREVSLIGATQAPQALTLKELERLYLSHHPEQGPKPPKGTKGKPLTAARRRHVGQVFALLRELLGDEFKVEDFAQEHVHAYTRGR